MKKIAFLVCLFISSTCLAGTYSNVSVGTSATLIVNADKNRAAFVLGNNCSAITYIGFDSNVTTTTGMPIAANGILGEDGNYRWTGAIYGIVASATCDVRYMTWGYSEVSQ